MKSVLALSMHKAGSTIADSIILEFCKEKGYGIDRISKAVSSAPIPESQVFVDAQANMLDRGFYYGMARGAYVKEMSKIYQLRLLVQIRDPRDCITSSYYSRRESHVPPKNPQKRIEFNAKRSKARALTIDEYAEKCIKQYKQRMSVLRGILEIHDDILLIKYEEMVEQTDNWLAKISKFLDQPLTKSLAHRLGCRLDFSVEDEDPSRHKRQVAPGDHIRKLKSETISYMNTIAVNERRYFGYLTQP